MTGSETILKQLFLRNYLVEWRDQSCFDLQYCRHMTPPINFNVLWSERFSSPSSSVWHGLIGFGMVWQTMLNHEDQKHRYPKKSKHIPWAFQGQKGWQQLDAHVADRFSHAVPHFLTSCPLWVVGRAWHTSIVIHCLSQRISKPSTVAVHDRPRMIAQVQKTASESGPGQAETGRLWMWVLCNQNLWQRRARVVLLCILPVCCMMLYDYTILFWSVMHIYIIMYIFIHI